MNILRRYLKCYDPDLLDELPNEIANKIIKISLKSLQINQGFVSLSKNIINHFFSRMDPIKDLIGPISLTEYYSDKHNKHIYLFGDNHSIIKKEEKGILISEWLKNVVKTTDRFLDIFIEMSRDNKIKYKDSYLNRVQKVFQNISLPNVRIHFIDIRELNDVLLNFISQTQNLNYLLSNNKLIYHLEVIKRSIQNYIRNGDKLFGNFDNNGDRIKELYYNSTFKISKTDKQLKNITNKNIRKTIERFFEHCLQYECSLLRWKRFKYLLLTYLNNITKDTTNILKEIEDNFLTISNIGNCIMDFYFLSRLFRTFRKIKNKYSSSPKSIIVYAGEDHIKNYRTFLEKLKFERIKYIRHEITVPSVFKNLENGKKV